jgi:hypothetical protein
MSLDSLGNDPCSKLNTTSYPDLWIQTTALDSDTYPRIATNGTTISMLNMLNTIKSKGFSGNVLAVPERNSSNRLLQFLSGVGVAGSNYGSLGSILLGSSTSPETIVDTYFIGSNPNYATSYGSMFDKAKLSAIMTTLQTNGYLLKESDIYLPAQLGTLATPPAISSQSLIFLYKTQQSGTLSAQQTERKTFLEATNLRFFSAFLIEYCYYRTRYQWLLQKYFVTYKEATTSFKAPTGNTLLLFQTGSGTADNQAQNLGNVKQSELLKAMAYHMAILNTRMTDLRMLLSIINDEYSRIFQLVQKNVNDESLAGSNADLTKTVKALQDSAKEAKQYMNEAQFSQRAVEYTEEKNRHATVLLGLYAVLNIAALAMIYKLK